jgi:hypothetical protein
MSTPTLEGVPHSTYVVDLKASEEVCHAQIKAVCRELVQGWDSVPDEAMQVGV